jgi:hypothetical protein
MGERQVRQEALFYGFSLQEHVPANHLLRAIDRFVELSDIRRQLKPFYSAVGRPSVDPELLICMLLIGYAPFSVIGWCARDPESGRSTHGALTSRQEPDADPNAAPATIRGDRAGHGVGRAAAEKHDHAADALRPREAPHRLLGTEQDGGLRAR